MVIKFKFYTITWLALKFFNLKHHSVVSQLLMFVCYQLVRNWIKLLR